MSTDPTQKSETEQPRPVMNIHLSPESGLTISLTPEMVHQIVLKWAEENPQIASIVALAFLSQQKELQKNASLAEMVQRTKNRQ